MFIPTTKPNCSGFKIKNKSITKWPTFIVPSALKSWLNKGVKIKCENLNSLNKISHQILWDKNSTLVTSISLKCPLHSLGLWVHNNLSKYFPKGYFSHAVISLNTSNDNNKLILKKVFLSHFYYFSMSVLDA